VPTSDPRRIETLEEFLSLPQDGMDRWAIRAELREKPWTPRALRHAQTMSALATELGNWCDQQPERGAVLVCLPFVCLPLEALTVVGVDAVYLAPSLLASQRPTMPFVEGVPTLAVEILAPDDTVGEIDEKVDAYLAAGVPLVWIIEPRRQTVTVVTPGDEPVLFNIRQDVAAEPHLPGFRIPVARLFE
jgi:Uma2 family endonuclease